MIGLEKKPLNFKYLMETEGNSNRKKEEHTGI